MLHTRPSVFVLAAGLLAGCMIPSVADAQRIVSTLDAQGTRLRYADTVDATAAGITPSVRLNWKNAELGSSGTFAQLGHAWSANGSLDASVSTPSAGPLSAELAGTLGGSTHQDGTRTGSAIGLGRMHLDGASVGTWIGAGAGATSDGFAWRRVREGEAGVWLGNGPATLTLIVQPTVVDDSIRYTDLTADGNWHGGILELGAIAGTRAGARLPLVASSATAWGSVNAAAWVLPRVALLASAGTYPVDYTQSFPGGRFVSVGVRLSLTPRLRPAASPLAIEPGVAASGVAELQLTRAGDRKWTLRLRAPEVRKLEVNGDFTGWQPRTLDREADGWYALAAPLASGTYQLNVRVNGGEWTPPPSLPTVRDEFGGTAGVLVVP